MVEYSPNSSYEKPETSEVSGTSKTGLDRFDFWKSNNPLKDGCVSCNSGCGSCGSCGSSCGAGGCSGCNSCSSCS